MSGRLARFVSAMAAAMVLVVAIPVVRPLAAQQTAEQRLRAQREELERIRRERSDLQSRMSELQGKAHTLSEEVTNLHRQADATSRLVRSLDQQLVSITADVESTTANLARAEGEVAQRRGVLRKRLVDIYKRGPLYSTEAMLSARSFGELVSRYKYLHELTLRDRSVVHRVESLYQQIHGQRQLLLRLQEEFTRNLTEKAEEERRLRALEQQRGKSLVQVRQSQQQVEERLKRIARDETRLANVIASFEETRKRNEARPNAGGPSTSTIRTSDFGKLDWPVSGTILYSFGRAINPNNTAIRWNGVGIGAASGSPVKSVAAGEIMIAEPVGTYGLTVIVQHGGGDYSVYGSLSRSDVRKGQTVQKGQTIGAVGSADPDMEPHLHFEIRPKGRATDPLAWLQKSR